MKRKVIREPFTGVRFQDDAAETQSINKADLIKIQNVQLDNNRHNLHMDKFLFMCYTGLSHEDVLNIKRSSLDGNFLQVKRSKSRVLISQVLPKKAMAILKYYEDCPEVEIDDSLFPRVSLDKTNVNLKVVGVMANTSVLLSTKLARVFFREVLDDIGLSEKVLKNAMMRHSQGNNIDKHYLRARKERLLGISKK